MICMTALCGLNVGMLDDRVCSAIDNVKYTVKNTTITSDTLIQVLRCLYKFGDIPGLVEVLRQFTADVVFIKPTDVVALIRICVVHGKGSEVLPSLIDTSSEYIRSAFHALTLDDKLSYLLSCSDFCEHHEMVSLALTMYAANVANFDSGNWRTLKTVLTSLRLYKKFRTLENGSAMPKLASQSLEKVLECIEQLDRNYSLEHCDLISRTCYMLAVLCRNDKADDNVNALFRLLWNISGDDNANMFTTRSVIYIIRAMLLFRLGDSTVKRGFVSLVIIKGTRISLPDAVSCLKCIDDHDFTGISSQILSLISGFDSGSYASLLKCYARHSARLSTHVLEQLRSQFCAIYNRMSPLEFAQCFSYSVAMGLVDGPTLQMAVAYINKHSMHLRPREVSLLFHAFTKTRYIPPDNVIKIFYRVLQTNTTQIALDDMIRCYNFISKHRIHSFGITDFLFKAIEKLLDGQVPIYQLCFLAFATIRCRDRRFKTRVYSAIFECCKNMTMQQLCFICKTLAMSVCRNRDIYAKLCNQMRNHGSFGTQDIENIIAAIRHGNLPESFIQWILDECPMTPAQRFVLFGGDVDVEKLDDSEVLICIMSVRDKSRITFHNHVIKRLCTRICKMSSTISPYVAQAVTDALQNTGHLKPKLDRLLTKENKNEYCKRMRNHVNGVYRGDALPTRKSESLGFRSILFHPPHVHPYGL
ncbi:hypothetical protein BBBOND_0205470 [Babesia bigemina]|uniref:RAP domain-containing protein n=1 Tax=Babesia bigemina TaxID=5866 RepID=A0A061D922_BABBI|nr:hypothetical protein BBBOND_0205470 [Babesia bigemina]CDR95389.1 hypothetical protein BBBOND_0205470 [Babesia bigemina]|eukprot:XP_012767575.1 hypothetical protein BBBOND_0205470 [Babesia bigemina]